MAISDAFAKLGKGLLHAAFPAVYESVNKSRNILDKGDKSDINEQETPLLKAIDRLNKNVKDGNEISADTLESILAQNDLLSKILKKGGVGSGSGGGLLDFFKGLIPTSTSGVVTGAAAVAGGVAARKVVSAIRGKSGRYMSAAQAAANPELVAGGTAVAKKVSGLAKLGKFLRLPGLSGLIAGGEEYMDSGNLAKSATVGVGAEVGGLGGAALGAALGTMVLPGIGTVAGGLIGGFAGSFTGNKIAGTAYDMAADSSTSQSFDVVNYKAELIGLKAQEIIISALNIKGLNAGGGQIGSAVATGSGSSPVFRHGIGGNEGQRHRRLQSGIEGGAGEGMPRVKGGGKPGAPGVDTSTLPIPGTKGVGKYNLYSGDPTGDYAKENIVPVETPYGTINVNKNSAAAFKGYFDELKSAGAPLQSLGSYSLRQKQSAGAGHNPGGGWSQHSYGNAIDMDNTTSLSPAMQQWINENPDRFDSLKQKWGMKQGIKGDLPHTEFGGVISPEAQKQLEESHKDGKLVTTIPKTPEQEQKEYNDSMKGNPLGVGVEKPPPGPTSYNLNMPKVLKTIKEKYPMSGMLSDESLKQRVKDELISANPNLKFEGDKITGASSDVDKLKVGLKEKLDINAADYMKPIKFGEDDFGDSSKMTGPEWPTHWGKPYTDLSNSGNVEDRRGGGWWVNNITEHTNKNTKGVGREYLNKLLGEDKTGIGPLSDQLGLIDIDDPLPQSMRWDPELAFPKAPPAPIQTQDPFVERLKTERDKLKKDVNRLKKRVKDDSPKTKDSDDNEVPPPKDNTRSDRALFNINPQLHEENHPQ